MTYREYLDRIYNGPMNQHPLKIIRRTSTALDSLFKLELNATKVCASWFLATCNDERLKATFLLFIK